MMAKLQIAHLNFNEYAISLNHQIQRQVKGGFNTELFNLLEQNKENIVGSYGDIPNANAFMFNIQIDIGSNNQIYQSPV
ncbi:hypothetical protein [Mastigocoleus testarum]|nr:hypothetical protein [Mastigocoleus testarum]